MEKKILYKEFLYTMTINEIIEELARNKVVEEIISNISKGTFKDTEELAQDIYLDLLTKSPELIIGLYERNELKFFITRMVRNNLFSHNSPYFQKYQRWNERRSEITQDIKDNLENDRD